MEIHSELYQGGRVTIPIPIRKQFGMEKGDQLVFRIEDDQILLLTEAQLLKEARAALKRELPSDISLVEELIADRRAEVAQETQEEPTA